MRIRRRMLAVVAGAILAVAMVPATAAAQGIHWGAGGNWYRGDYGQVFVGAAVVSANNGFFYVQSASLDGKVLNPCGRYQHVNLEGVQGEVHSLTPQQLSWNVATVANSACQNGISVPYPITISGTFRGEFFDSPCWWSGNGVSDMTVTWGGSVTSYFPTNNQYSNICRYGI